VTDVFDALTNARPYRRALTPAAAVEVLREETKRGSWDGSIVEALASMLGREGRSDRKAESASGPVRLAAPLDSPLRPVGWAACSLRHGLRNAGTAVQWVTSAKV